eukprot:TRINITY_DN12410_c0_g1_i1.p1 TRINITY_DN12410_c0_g1~~TRINITY_DN12410_c0_g1_i1.p1  ORF type:complete len:438 (-),score=35.40 TRINITY_DN12410_c0_g1_i1:87-1400(-)
MNFAMWRAGSSATVPSQLVIKKRRKRKREANILKCEVYLHRFQASWDLVQTYNNTNLWLFASVNQYALTQESAQIIFRTDSEERSLLGLTFYTALCAVSLHICNMELAKECFERARYHLEDFFDVLDYNVAEALVILGEYILMIDPSNMTRAMTYWTAAINICKLTGKYNSSAYLQARFLTLFSRDLNSLPFSEVLEVFKDYLLVQRDYKFFHPNTPLPSKSDLNGQQIMEYVSVFARIIGTTTGALCWYAGQTEQDEISTEQLACLLPKLNTVSSLSRKMPAIICNTFTLVSLALQTGIFTILGKTDSADTSARLFLEILTHIDKNQRFRRICQFMPFVLEHFLRNNDFKSAAEILECVKHISSNLPWVEQFFVAYEDRINSGNLLIPLSPDICIVDAKSDPREEIAIQNPATHKKTSKSKRWYSWKPTINNFKPL